MGVSAELIDRFSPLSIAGAWVYEPPQHGDDRGMFVENFRGDALAELVGHPIQIQQGNLSTSAPGALRGIHYALLPPGQAKYVSCAAGKIWDVVVDLRVDSPTYGQWEGVELSADNRKSLYIAEGLGHGFLALTPSTVMYGCSTVFTSGNEFAVNPFDDQLAISWPTDEVTGWDGNPILSEKDLNAPSLAQQTQAGRLPNKASFENTL